MLTTGATRVPNLKASVQIDQEAQAEAFVPHEAVRETPEVQNTRRVHRLPVYPRA